MPPFPRLPCGRLGDRMKGGHLSEVPQPKRLFRVNHRGPA